MNVALMFPLILTFTLAGGGIEQPNPATAAVDNSWLVSPTPVTRSRLPLDSQNEVARLLGRDRMRRLRQANFHLHRFSFDPGRTLADEPLIHDEVVDIARSNILKLGREALEQRLDLEGRIDRLLGRRTRALDGGDGGGTGFDFSPQIRVASDSALGVKIGWRTGNRFLDHTRFEIREYLSSGTTLLRLQYAHGDDFLMLEHRMDDPRVGDQYSLLFRTSF